MDKASRDIILDGPVDNIDAFNYIGNYLYSGGKSYIIVMKEATPYRISSAAVVHTRVFLMADRIGLDETQAFAFKRVKALMLEPYDKATAKGNWLCGNLSNIIDLVYSYDPLPADKHKKQKQPTSGGSSMHSQMRRLLAH